MPFNANKCPIFKYASSFIGILDEADSDRGNANRDRNVLDKRKENKSKPEFHMVCNHLLNALREISLL